MSHMSHIQSQAHHQGTDFYARCPPVTQMCHPCCSSFWCCKPSGVIWLIFSDFQFFRDSNRFHTPLIFLANTALSCHLSISVGWLSWLVNCVDCPVRPSQLRCGCATDYSIGRARGRMHKRFSGFTDGCLQNSLLEIGYLRSVPKEKAS